MAENPSPHKQAAKKNAIVKPKPKPAAAPQISSADLPKKTLEEALKVARVIKDQYAGKLATWADIAKGMGLFTSEST